MSSPFVRHRTRRSASALALAVGAGLTASIALPVTADAAAAAARVERGDGGRSIIYTAASGQTNKVSVTATSTDGSAHITYVIDDVVPIDIAPTEQNCSYPDNADRTKVSCTQTTMASQVSYGTLSMTLGDGDDTITYNNATGQAHYIAAIDLGDGKDRSTHIGSVDGNEVEGGPGDDTIRLGTYGMAFAEAGNDTIYTADRAVATGQSGVDTIYANGDETDADGGTGNDFIYGGPGRQRLNGGDGNDTVRGGTGNDIVYGSPGADILYGNSGNDTLYGNSGNDRLYGGPGKDTLSGGPGADVLRQD
ncbi:calcium-binding protein [Streptomyces olivochromogenes]|uniref:calcium-binding protein n=1 Tax=Streptomyces olivochromogenes TaxID=1963 RepID=UPI002285FD36|nr:calcium-binding protein [Streptomyces olivochromogenes]MCF3130480.1 calcium-binding protein [Streptomyces olivochromogenes]